ncbi:MAG: serine/threonine-protein kinase, partial [Persicimonas sp.]
MNDDSTDSPVPPTPDGKSRRAATSRGVARRSFGPPSASALLEKRLGPFEVHEVLGRGGMGVVYAGKHAEQGVPVAIKILTGVDPINSKLRRRLRHEVHAIARLNHPAIVKIFDYGEVDEPVSLLTSGEIATGAPYYVMERTEPGTLRKLGGRLDWPRIKAILLTLLDALAHAHAAGVIHRDIKPGNILLGRRGSRAVPKLGDFGISFAVEMSSSRSHCIGTPRYMAPEQINESWRLHGPWSDLYSLGCVAFELVCGDQLFEGSDLVEIYQKHFRPHHPRLEPVVALPDD